jgi:hypothetical protein
MVKQGDELTAIIWEMALVHEGEGPKGHFPQYKGFELLLNFLLKTMRIHGGSKRTVLGPLKMSLSSDLKWEKKLLAEYKDGIFQFFLTGLITWIFAIFSSWILEIELGTWTSLAIFFAQVIGVIIFHYFIKYFENKYFLSLFQISQKLIRFDALLKTSLSIQEILEFSEINNLPSVTENVVLRPLILSLLQLVRKWKNFGVCIKSEVIEIRYDISFLFDENFRKFIDLVKFLKFLILCMFFLTPYFLSIGSLLSGFLIE